MSTLPLSDIVNISIVVSPVATIRPGFDLGLIVGSSTVITPTVRVKTYTSTTDMITDGFTTDNAEYKSATLYFSQNPKPDKVAIGRWDQTGTETAAQAVMACRAINTDWYACYISGSVGNTASALDVSAYIEACEPDSTYFYVNSDVDVLNNVPGNLMSTLKGLGYKRSIGQYTTFPNAVASIMGYAMGANTGLANTAYTLAYKQEIGVTPEVLTETQLINLINQNANFYVNRGNTYNLFQQGVMANGMHFDEIINLDMLKNDIQIAIMDLLTGASKIPQDEGGITLLISAITGPCESAKKRGFLAPGVWNAPPILGLNTGDMLSQGYAILSETINSQSELDRSGRLAPPIYVCVKLAGAIEFVSIQINVNR